MGGSVCQCGCGEIASIGSFLPGHDQKLRIALEQRAGGIEGLRKLVEESERKEPNDSPTPAKCQQEIDDLFKTINADQAEYDKQLLTLSSGFLAVSLAFIKDIVHLADAVFLSLLYLSFAWFSVCIIFVLFSYQFSISGHLKAKAYWEGKKEGNDPEFPFKHAECAKWLNRINGVLFVLGVLSISTFVILNIHREARMAIANDGAYIKTPAKGSEDRGSLIKAPAKPAPNQPGSSGGSGGGQKK